MASSRPGVDPGFGRRVLAASVLSALALVHAPGPASSARATPAVEAVEPARPFDFLAVGDWGRGNRHQREVADAMARWAAEHPVRFVISTGDNFYPYGVSSTTDPKWKTSFEDVYAAESLRVPWYAALGNHDERGNAAAQIAYGARSLRWRMPARSYTFTEAGDGFRAQFFVLDTSPFLDTYRSFFSITKVAGQDPAAQRDWLGKELAASSAEWKLVVGHHPIRSCGPHGDSPELVRDILPLLVRFGVPLYLNGHDHDLQDLESDGLRFLTSGAGSDLTRVSPDERTAWAEAVGGFFVFTVSRDTLTLKAVDSRGRVRHTATIPGRATRR